MSGRGATPADDSELAERIASASRALDLPLPAAAAERLVSYLRLVERWNATYNLTSVRQVEAMVSHHVADCLAAAAALRTRRAPERRRRLLDVGSGAGLPGLVIAVALPDTQVVCIERVRKKTAFITHAVAAIGLRNATVRHGRVEQLDPASYDVIASRAFASLSDFVSSTRHLLADNGEWLAMKGRLPTAEISKLPEDLRAEAEQLRVPGLDAERHLIWLHRLH